MTVTKVTPTYGSLVGTGHLAGVREYTKVFTVVTDTFQDGVKTVGNAFGIPHKGDTYFWYGEVDAGALCTSVTPVRNTDSELWWSVTCEFSSDTRGSGPEGSLSQDPRYDNDNPFANPPTVTWDHWEEEITIDWDRDGAAILTPAGKPYSPPLKRRVKHSRVVVVRNEPVYPTALDQSMRGLLNRDAFFGWAPRQAKMEDISGTNQFSQGMIYWQIRYEIRFKKPDFDEDLLNAGTVVLVWNDAITELIESLPTDEKTGIQHTNLAMMHGEDNNLGSKGEQMTAEQVKLKRAIPPRNPGSLYTKYEVDDDTPFAVLNF